MFEITKDILLNAEDYVPLAEKARIAGEISRRCVNAITYQLEVGGVTVDVPDYYGKNIALRERHLLGVLMQKYLKIQFDPVEGEEFLLSLDDYDRAARLHPMNALERFKSDATTREKVFDLLRDYKSLCEMTRIALDDIVAAQNDPVQRYLAAQASMVTPEALEALTNAEGKLREELESLKLTSEDARGALGAFRRK